MNDKIANKYMIQVFDIGETHAKFLHIETNRGNESDFFLSTKWDFNRKE